MLLNLSEELPIAATPEEVWKILRDTARLTRLLPGVERVTMINGPAEAYAAKISDRIGPFKITLNVEVHITESREPSLLTAAIQGADSLNLNRISGSLNIALAPAQPGTTARFNASIEVLGKLATLGATPIRRRTTESFAEFARNLQREFVPGTSAQQRP